MFTKIEREREDDIERGRSSFVRVLLTVSPFPFDGIIDTRSQTLSHARGNPKLKPQHDLTLN